MPTAFPYSASQSIADNGFLPGMSKKQLDAGVGGSLFRDKDRLEETIVRGYPQLRKEKGKWIIS